MRHRYPGFSNRSIVRSEVVKSFLAHSGKLEHDEILNIPNLDNNEQENRCRIDAIMGKKRVSMNHKNPPSFGGARHSCRLHVNLSDTSKKEEISDLPKSKRNKCRDPRLTGTKRMKSRMAVTLEPGKDGFHSAPGSLAPGGGGGGFSYPIYG